jgi:hypothetical protein
MPNHLMGKRDVDIGMRGFGVCCSWVAASVIYLKVARGLTRFSGDCKAKTFVFLSFFVRERLTKPQETTHSLKTGSNHAAFINFPASQLWRRLYPGEPR